MSTTAVPMHPERFIDIQSVEQTFRTRQGDFTALRDIHLTVAQGEFVTLIGHSGCGKSTLLNLIAGLTRPTAGVLLCADREIKGPGPERAVVFQNHSLLPWLTCADNVYLAVERVFGATEPKARLRERTAAALELVGLSHAAAKRPGEISGGMKQRVGIARALSMEPQVLLMDEPFASVDIVLRRKLRRECRILLREAGAEVIWYLAMGNPFTHAVELMRFAAYGQFNAVSCAVVVGVGLGVGQVVVEGFAVPQIGHPPVPSLRHHPQVDDARGI